MEFLYSKSKVTWVASLILVVWLYIIYYSLIHPYLLKSYKDQFYLVPFVCNAVECGTSEVNVTLIMPKYLSGGQSQIAYIKMENSSNDRIAGNMALVVSDEKGDTLDEMGKLPLIFNNFNETNIQTGSIFGFDLQPRDSVILQIPFVVLGDTLDMDEVHLYYESANSIVKDELKPNATYGNIKINIINSSFSILLRKIMLPPWANGFLPALGFLSCWLFESQAIKYYNENNGRGETSKSVKPPYDEIPPFSEGGMMMIGYFFVLGNLFSSPIVSIFLLSTVLGSPSLLIAAPPALLGVWVLFREKIYSQVEKIINAVNKPLTLAVIILVLGLISVKGSLDVFSNDIQMFSVMDISESLLFVARNIILLFLYCMAFFVVAPKIFNDSKKNAPAKVDGSDTAKQNTEIPLVNNRAVGDGRTKKKKKVNPSGEDYDGKSSLLKTKNILSVGRDVFIEQDVELGKNNKGSGVLNENHIPVVFVDAETLQNLENMSPIVKNLSLSDLAPLGEIKTEDSAENVPLEYVCNNCGYYQGKTLTEKCNNCKSTDIVIKT